jgi:hypothetical protein
MPNAKNSNIQIASNKEFLTTHLLANDNKDIVMLFNVELNNVFNKFSMLSSPNIRHTIKSFKNVTKKNGYIDIILELKRRQCYNYIQDSDFLGQGVPKVYLFKMSTHGLASGVDIVMRMQLGRDFENAWIMFDHVKHVQGWTTMGCHGFDMAYCKVLTIDICDMQSEDVDSQILMWYSLTRLFKKV